ncbi:unnamed protein product [Paramecium pentaurelia]|uniref:Cullin family profile domain-containing protein n=1 Tax=Paramecium pentaurelia TaxID=43138 RepID=A0A8S1SVE7_9CILI|nr:unnamed protein product [Paramecium pentaurelia]
MIVENEHTDEFHQLLNNIINQNPVSKPYLLYYQKLKSNQKYHQQIFNLIIQEFQYHTQTKLIFQDFSQIISQHQQIQSQIKLIDQIFKTIESSQNQSINKVLNQIYQTKIYNYKDKILTLFLNQFLILRQNEIDNKLLQLIAFIKSTQFCQEFKQSLIEKSIIFYNKFTSIEQLHQQYLVEEKIIELFQDVQLGISLREEFSKVIARNLSDTPILLENMSQMKIYFELNQIIDSNILKGKIFDMVYQDMIKVINNENKQQIINNLFETKEYYEQKVSDLFQNNEKIKISLSSAIETAIQLKVNQLSEQLSSYFDQLLIKKQENKDFVKVQERIKKTLELMPYFSAKDIFEHFYTQRMTRRLLLELSISQELETEILINLKQQCGDQYVRKAEEVLKEYKKCYQYQHQGVEVKLVVISQNSWTLKQDQIPKFFLKEQQQYFLESQNQELKQKILLWMLECSNCYVKGFNKYIFIVSAVQAMILDLFNNQKSYKAQEFIQLSGLSKDEIIRNLIPLEKEKILILDQGTYSVNYEFESKKTHIKINQMQKIEKKEEIEENTQKLLHDRKYVIDASIVKIMKRDKQHTLQEIVNLVLKDLGLPIKVVDIKQQIEVLTEKEYLQRDQQDMSLFIYLA